MKLRQFSTHSIIYWPYYEDSSFDHALHHFTNIVTIFVIDLRNIIPLNSRHSSYFDTKFPPDSRTVTCSLSLSFCRLKTKQGGYVENAA